MAKASKSFKAAVKAAAARGKPALRAIKGEAAKSPAGQAGGQARLKAVALKPFAPARGRRRSR